jgi:hypothetical protein
MTPAFTFPDCPTCKRPVERLTIEHNTLTGTYLINAFCHGKARLLRLTEDDLVGYETGPLVTLRLE